MSTLLKNKVDALRKEAESIIEAARVILRDEAGLSLSSSFSCQVVEPEYITDVTGEYVNIVFDGRTIYGAILLNDKYADGYIQSYNATTGKYIFAVRYNDGRHRTMEYEGKIYRTRRTR